MGRQKEAISEDEMKYFYRNYLYMWDELLTTSPYKAKEEETDRKENILPAFCTLSRMYNDAKKMEQNPEYMPAEKDIPSMYQVKKIVNYYNQHMIPMITPGEFIHSNLKSDYHCGPTDKNAPDCFDGTYYCYYCSDCQEIHGAVMQIRRQEDGIKVTMVSGFGFGSQAEIERAKGITSYKQYYDFAKQYKHFYYYEGSAVAGEKTLYMNLSGRDASQRILTLAFNVERYMDRYRRFSASSEFVGALGCAISTSFSSSAAQPRMYLFGMAAGRQNERTNFAALKEMIESPELREILRMKNTQKGFLALEPEMNKRWIKLVDSKNL